MSGGIVFQVETTRILEILAREIYDSPLALLRENLQNGYDAVRMRFARSGRLDEGGRIDVEIDGQRISITDNGVGMDEAVLRGNFWKAGSSGKHSADARRAGVVGTFGIGAMANFGVCSKLTVETRAEGATEVLRSVAEKDALKIGEECIRLERIASDRDVGTTVTALLEPQHAISPQQARQYLEPYVSLLPVPVFLNGESVTGATVESRWGLGSRAFRQLATRQLADDLCAGTFTVHADPNGQILVAVENVSLAGNAVEGSMTLVQGGGQLMGFRSFFGLAPIPAVGSYQCGGFANLAFLQPTAGREALTRESIDQVSRLVGLAERVASEVLAETPEADRNNAFLQWLMAHGRYELATRVCIRILPDERDVELGAVKSYVDGRTAHYYAGTDGQIVTTFANEGSCLLQVVQGNPRRAVQLQYLQRQGGIPEVPDAAQVTRIYKGTELSVPEVSILLRVASILRDDYLIADVEIVLAEISHGVTVLPEKAGDHLRVYLARSSPLLPPLLEFYDKAYDVFAPLMKDFVRNRIYKSIQQFVPSSTREGVDALRQLLQRNRELYSYEETERGDLEGLLGEYLSGTASFTDVLKVTRAAAHAQTVSVSHDQVGTIENVVPDVVTSPVTPIVEDGLEFAPTPPIVRDDVSSDMKILTTGQRYAQLNNFTMLLGLSDRLMRTEAEFFRVPHTTRILWGGHRVIYIFTEATGRLSLYYDVELREPIVGSKTGGGMFPTTTLITKKRIFVPVPDTLVEEFRIAAGPKQFYVRFDVINSDVA